MFIIDWLWGLLPWQAQWGLIACAVLFVGGVIWRFKDVLALIKKIAGWPGVAAVVAAIGIILAVFWPKARPPKAKPEAKPSNPFWPPLGRTSKRSPAPRKKRKLDENGYWIDL